CDAIAHAGSDVFSPSLELVQARTAPPVASTVVMQIGPGIVMASSGTTGPRKLIPLSEAQLLHTAFAVAHHHQLTPDDRGYSPLPLFHINGLVVGVLSTLVAGSSLVLDRRFSARNFWPVVHEHHVTWLNLVPAIIAVLAGERAATPPPDVAACLPFARPAPA